MCGGRERGREKEGERKRPHATSAVVCEGRARCEEKGAQKLYERKKAEIRADDSLASLEDVHSPIERERTCLHVIPLSRGISHPCVR